MLRRATAGQASFRDERSGRDCHAGVPAEQGAGGRAWLTALVGYGLAGQESIFVLFVEVTGCVELNQENKRGS